MHAYERVKHPEIRVSGTDPRFKQPTAHGLRVQIPESHKGLPVVSVHREITACLSSSFRFGDWKKTIASDIPEADDFSFMEYLNLVYSQMEQYKNPFFEYDSKFGFHGFRMILFFSENPEIILNATDPVNAFYDELSNVRFLVTSQLNNDLSKLLRDYNYEEKHIQAIINESPKNVSSKASNIINSQEIAFLKEKESFYYSVAALMNWKTP